MNVIIRLALFTFMLNISIGLIILAVPQLNTAGLPGDSGVISSAYTGGLIYNQNDTSSFDSLQNNVTPSKQLEDVADSNFLLLDLFNFGIITKIINVIKTILYGFPIMLRRLLGAFIEDTLESFLFGSINTIITLGYILAAVSLFTGRNFFRE